VAVVYALIAGVFIFRELKPKILFKALISGAKMSAVVMFLAATAQVAAYMLTISRIPQVITASLLHIPDNSCLYSDTVSGNDSLSAQVDSRVQRGTDG
jgi:TRAP-type C4-dicarboxylate transport system permease large subunit